MRESTRGAMSASACGGLASSILTGSQPIYNEDRRVWIVFNGEIYNFRELRKELEKRGHEFYTHSDTEVIVHLYEEMGADCVRKLRGMFAIALYDEKTMSLLLARDRLGKKPLYYACTKGVFISGPKSRQCWPWRRNWPRLIPRAFFSSFTSGIFPIRSPRFATSESCRPVTWRSDGDGEIQFGKYWDVPAYGANDPGSDEACLEKMEARLAEAVRIRLISDVPLGAF